MQKDPAGGGVQDLAKSDRQRNPKAPWQARGINPGEP